MLIKNVPSSKAVIIRNNECSSNYPALPGIIVNGKQGTVPFLHNEGKAFPPDPQHCKFKLVHRKVLASQGLGSLRNPTQFIPDDPNWSNL